MKRNVLVIALVVVALTVAVLCVDRIPWEGELIGSANRLKINFLDACATAQRVPSESELAVLVKQWGDSVVDPWGRHYVLRIGTNESTASITSLGRDGKHGGDALDADFEWSFRYKTVDGSWISTTSLQACVWLSQPFREGEGVSSQVQDSDVTNGTSMTDPDIGSSSSSP